MSRRILIDTSAIFALLSPTDDFHTLARDTYTDLLDRGDQLYSTSYILVETSALVRRRLGFEPLKTFIESIQGVWDVLWVDRVAHEDAWRRMVGRNGSRLSFVDWSTIVAAENTRSTIFAFDQDFHQEGLMVIPSSKQQA
ncbi:MAG TPA: PIN domain-containing protein [Dehalococcoidia bacterium]|nr:PIN domain-containing protein [Dehalococcoidia bacterium]